MSTLNYASEVDLENLLLVDIDSSFSTQIATWITAAERRVNRFLGYTTVSGLWNEQITGEIVESRVDGDLNLVIHPRKRPINSVSKIQLLKGTVSVTLDLTNTAGDTKYVIPQPNLVIIYPNRELALQATSGVFLRSFSDIKYTRAFTKINYIAGYTSIPEDIALATALFTADTFMRQANKEGLSSITQGKVSKRWSEGRDGKSQFVLDAEALLLSYRIASGWV